MARDAPHDLSRSGAIKQYFSQIEGAFIYRGRSRCDEDGYFWIMGRVDDVINVSVIGLGTMEVESALVSHPRWRSRPASAARRGERSAVVAVRHAGGRAQGRRGVARRTEHHVVKEIGALARPDEMRFSDALPKTRSGKIMRRLLRQCGGRPVRSAT